jgi:hypothetical protein
VPVYQNSQQVCEVMTDLFGRAMNDPDTLRELRSARMVLRLDITDPSALVTVDGKTPTPHFQCGPSNAPADLILHTRMDVIHQVWLNQIKLKDAFFSGQIKVDGSVLRAMSLGGLFRQIEAMYPHVLRERGILS